MIPCFRGANVSSMGAHAAKDLLGAINRYTSIDVSGLAWSVYGKTNEEHRLNSMADMPLLQSINIDMLGLLWGVELEAELELKVYVHACERIVCHGLAPVVSCYSVISILLLSGANRHSHAQ
jgi:hypothetical protein